MEYADQKESHVFSLDAIATGFGPVGAAVREELARLEDYSSFTDFQILDLEGLELAL